MNGMFFLNSRIRRDDVTDGLTYTIFLGEKTPDRIVDLGWMSGTRATLRNMGTPIRKTTLDPSGLVGSSLGSLDESSELGGELGQFEPQESDPSADSSETSEPAGLVDAAATEDTVETEDAASTGGASDPALYFGGFGSFHLGVGAIFGIGDGSVRTLDEGIDPRVYSQLGNRRDGQLISAEPW